MPESGRAVKATAWRVTKDREVFVTPDGPVIANKGDILMVVVRPTWAQMACVIGNLDEKPEPSK